MKRVLDVGQCNPDHAAVVSFLTRHFPGIEVGRAALGDDAMEQLRAERYDLVLVNRKLDEDYSDGVEVLRRIKADPATAGVPVMLVTNYPDHQQAAVEMGAVYGFGKLEYNDPQTVEKVRAVLEA
jgi:two-component system chemotaxis response regulator CheY